MKYGIVKVAAVTPTIRLNDPEHNAEEILSRVKELTSRGAEVIVFPELCVTGYTAGDLFYTSRLLQRSDDAVKKIAAGTPDNALVFFGAPISHNGRLYNCAVATSGGKILGFVPKTELPEYGEFYEKRYFTPAFDGTVMSDRFGAPMGNILFKCKNNDKLTVGCEICEDLWSDVSPSAEACRAGATLIVNLSASNETVGKAEYRRTLVSSASGRMRCAYVYADAGSGESATDSVFSGHDMIAENGVIVCESKPFADGLAVCDVDAEKLDAERRKTGMHPSVRKYEIAEFSLADGIKLERAPERYPFVPNGDDAPDRAELILTMQSRALGGRMAHIKAEKAVIGVSGGLDSALALLVCARAVKKERILPVTMPAFGTTDKTRNNAQRLCAALGLKLETVDIKDTVTKHLTDINHCEKDVTYENAQARTRTMTLFDLANKTGGLVVGTGDLSELALGWATYNGDHMSSYGVNAGVPKTLVKYLVKYEADRIGGDVKAALYDILDTDISPELLPPDKGKIAQKTEDIIGKYDLHDFIIYHYCRYGFAREKIAFLLESAFPEVSARTRQQTLDTFFKRFFAAQFKRSCMPDGVKIGSVSFSPRSDWRMPSDAFPED